MNLLSISSALSVLLLTSTVWAAPPKSQIPDMDMPPPPPMPSTSYLDTVSKMDADLVLLKKQADLKQAMTELHKSDHSNVFPDVAPPKVLSIYGSGGHRQADLIYDSGLVVQVSPGDLLPGGYRLVDIQARSVTVKSLTAGAKKSVPAQYLDFSVQTKTGFAGMMPGAPGMPGMR